MASKECQSVIGQCRPVVVQLHYSVKAAAFWYSLSPIFEAVTQQGPLGTLLQSEQHVAGYFS